MKVVIIMDNTKTLETERLILRKFTIEDAEGMFKNWATDSETNKFLAWPLHKSRRTPPPSSPPPCRTTRAGTMCWTR